MTQQSFLEPLPDKGWARPKGKGACGRDPATGPGTCWHWWDGCPKAAKRGCYLLYLRDRDNRSTQTAGKER